MALSLLLLERGFGTGGMGAGGVAGLDVGEVVDLGTGIGDVTEVGELRDDLFNNG